MKAELSVSADTPDADWVVKLIDVHPDENLLRASSNLPGVQVVSSGRVTARDLIDTRSVIITKSGAEHLVKVLAR